MWMLGIALVNHGDIVRDNILMLHGMQRQIDTRHSTHLPRPQTRRVHHMLGYDRALIGNHLPTAIGPRVCFNHFGMQLDLSPIHARCPGVRMSGTRWIKMAIQGVVKPAEQTGGVSRRCDLDDFRGRQNLGI